MANVAAAYRSAEIETLSQRDLIVRLYQGAERFLEQARQAMERRQPEPAHVNCLKAKAIFIELCSTLNFEAGGEVAGQLRDLYLFIIASISEANLRKDAARIAGIMPIVATLRGAWQEIPAEEANTSSLGAVQRGFSVKS